MYVTFLCVENIRAVSPTKMLMTAARLGGPVPAHSQWDAGMEATSVCCLCVHYAKAVCYVCWYNEQLASL